MKVTSFIPVIIILFVSGYLLWFHQLNQSSVIMPLLVSLPPAVVLAFAIVITFLAAWLPVRLKLWRARRKIKRMQRHITELEQHLPSYDNYATSSTPVIPDRHTPAHAPVSSATDNTENA